MRDPRLINLYDKPLQRRLLIARRSSASSGAGTAILAGTAIVLATGAFFWLYDAVAHSGTPYVPPTHAAVHARTDVLRVPPAVPAPDMSAPEVRRAEADVPPQPVAVAHSSGEQKPAVVASARKRKVARPARHLSPEARQAFAAGAGFYSRPFGGGF